MRVLFLGNKHAEASEVCLRRMMREKAFSISVCLYDPLCEGPLKAGRKLLKRYGASETAKKLTRTTLTKLSGVLKPKLLPEVAEPIESHLDRNGIKWFEWNEDDNAETMEAIRKAQPDVIAVSNFSMILGPDLLGLPPEGCVNVHPSLLPRYRGPVPVYWIVRNGETRSGVTVHYMIEQPDAGDIVLQKALDIEPDETETMLTRRKIRIAAEMLTDALHLVRKGEVRRKPQDEREATYYSFPRLQRLASRKGPR